MDHCTGCSTSSNSMSKTVNIGSTGQLNKLLQSNTIVVTDCTFLPSPNTIYIPYQLSSGIQPTKFFFQSTQIGVVLANRLPLFLNSSRHSYRDRTRSLLPESTQNSKKKSPRHTRSLRRLPCSIHCSLLLNQIYVS